MTIAERIRSLFSKKEPIDFRVKFVPVTNADSAYGNIGTYKKANDDNYANAVTSISWVYTANSIFSETAAMLPLKIYNKDKEVTSGLQYELINRPSEFVGACAFRQAMFGSFGFSGNSYIYIDPKKKRLWCLQPQDMALAADKENFIRSYIYRARKEESRLIDPLQLVHVKSYNPESYFYGLSPIQAAWSQVSYLDKDDIFWETFWKEGGRLQGIFTADGSLAEDSVTRLKEQLKSQYQGVRKMQANIVVDNGLKFEQLGVSQKDAQLIEKGKLTVLDVLAAYKIPPAIAGILDQSNYSNMEVQERLFYMLCILPKLRLFQEAFSAHEFMSVGGRLRYEFDLSGVEVLKDDEKGVIETAGMAVEKGLMTANEARNRYLQMPPLADGNVLREMNQAPQNQFGGLVYDVPQVKEIEAEKVLNIPRKPLNPQLSKDQKAEEAKAYDDLLAADDVSLQADIAKIFKAQKEIVLANIRAQLKNYGRMILTKAEGDDLTDGLSNGTQALIDTLRSHYSPIIDKFGKRTKSKIDNGAPDGFSARWNAGDPRIGRFISDRSIKFGGDINAETIQMVRDTLASGFDAGADVSELSEMVSEMFNGMEDWRARRIARTETAAAAQEAIDVGYQLNSDVVSGKEWVSARDNAVRDSHQESNLQSEVVGLNEDFILGDGEAATFPLAPGLSAGNSINCRCTTVPVLDFGGVTL